MVFFHDEVSESRFELTHVIVLSILLDLCAFLLFQLKNFLSSHFRVGDRVTEKFVVIDGFAEFFDGFEDFLSVFNFWQLKLFFVFLFEFDVHRGTS